MTVVLKGDYRNDKFIDKLNEDLFKFFGSNNDTKFNPWHFLQEEADYMNTDPEGLIQLKDWKRPISKEALEANFFWLKHGEFSFKLSGGGSDSDEARDAVAVCKWIRKTRSQFIDEKASFNYSMGTVQSYLNYVFEDAGYDLKKLWQLPIYEF
ncbi:hypothetical protein ACEN9X_09420 [Mucilaginibacter sp. Mucisp86]|uniref:hypothetical protein n=1 Tax=Mucilaginibacter sp. Mucisp86 TaxID=3243060 RepID=UPI0039B55230